MGAEHDVDATVGVDAEPPRPQRAGRQLGRGDQRLEHHRVDALDHATTPPRVVEFGLVVTDLF